MASTNQNSIDQCINLTNMAIVELRGVSTCVQMIGAHGSSHTHPRERIKCVSFHISTHGPSLRCCVASMDVIPVLDWLCNDISTSYMHTLMNWEGCQEVYGRLELMVHHTPPKAEIKCVSFHPSHHGISLECCIISVGVIPLFGCLSNGRPSSSMHPLMNWEGCQHTWMENCSSWYTIYHLRQRLNMCHFYPPPHGTFLECCMVSMDVIPLFGWLCNGRPSSHRHLLISWEGYQDVYGWLEIMVHCIPPMARVRSVPVFIYSLMAHLTASIYVIPLLGCL